MGFYNQLAEMVGYRLKNKKRSHDFLDTHLRQVFNRYEINTVIDVGANVGQYGLFLRKNGFKGKIISFEPLSETFQTLQKTASNDPLWQVFNFALGNLAEKKKINIVGKSGQTDFSSFLTPNKLAVTDFAVDTKESLSEIDVKVLGEMIEFLNLNPKSKIHLKMDTQGFDLNVFRGAGRVLDFVWSMQSEVSFVPIYDGMPTFLESLELFTDNGFKVSGIYPVSRNKQKLSLVESDAVLVRE